MSRAAAAPRYRHGPHDRPGAERAYCSDHCRRRFFEERDPADGTDDASILAVRERLAWATYQAQKGGPRAGFSRRGPGTGVGGGSPFRCRPQRISCRLTFDDEPG
jgi:hypothetical protein